jgi:haloalkane dehalogenase
MSALNEVRPGVLRTPDERFEGLPDYDFEPHYCDVRGLRVHYLDEGPSDADPILLMHGEPSWCFLYRKMIPGLVAAGHRIIAPDLVGFGRSDKLVDKDAYSYQFHVDIINELIRGIDLKKLTLFCQDWGGLIGIRCLIDNPDRFVRLIPANTTLPTGERAVSEAFLQWLEYSQNVENFHVGGIIKGGCAGDLSDEVIAAYNAPFPSDEYKACARIFPTFVPITPEHPGAAENKAGWGVLKNWPGKVLTLFSDQDAIMAGAFKPFQKLMPGAKGQPHSTIEGGGHFLQEDQGEVIAERIVDWMKSTT